MDGQTIKLVFLQVQPDGGKTLVVIMDTMQTVPASAADQTDTAMTHAQKLDYAVANNIAATQVMNVVSLL